MTSKTLFPSFAGRWPGAAEMLPFCSVPKGDPGSVVLRSKLHAAEGLPLGLCSKELRWGGREGWGGTGGTHPRRHPEFFCHSHGV